MISNKKVLPFAIAFAITGCSSPVGMPMSSSPVSVSQIDSAPQNGLPFEVKGVVDTAIRRTALVALVKFRVGQLSGQSVTNPSSYGTDASDGDGARIQNAIQIFKDSGWKTDNTVINNMKSALSSYNWSQEFPGDDRMTMINRIFAMVSSYKKDGVPKTNDAMLLSLGIQQQCKEFVNRSVSAVGGTPKPYYSTSVSLSSAVPGMLAYKGKSHAAVITGVIKDAKGNVTNFKVVDSNAGSGFYHPGGDIPWARLIREHEVKASDYYVVDIN